MPPTVTPNVFSLWGVNQLSKMRSVVVSQATTPTIAWTFLDAAGDPVDISSYNNSGFEVVLGVKHSLNTQSDDTAYSTGTVTTAASGLVSVVVPPEALVKPGIYVAEIVIRDSNISSHIVQLINRFWLVVDRSIFGGTDHLGPPTIAEIRLHLRDAPEGNILLDEYEFDVAEIAASISRCVAFFNESPPPIQRRFSTANFPFRYHWMEGVVADLFLSAAHQFRRNAVKSSAAGLSTSDLDKEKEYMQAHAYHKQNWTEFVKMTRIRMNMEEGFGSLGSDYRRY